MNRKHHREVHVDLNGTNDKFVVMGRVTHAMKRTALPEEEIDAFRQEARVTKTIEDLFAVCERWVTIEREQA